MTHQPESDNKSRFFFFFLNIKLKRMLFRLFKAQKTFKIVEYSQAKQKD